VSAGAVAQPARKRVLFIINSLAGGGAERVICTLLRASQGELRDSRISLLLLDREVAMSSAGWIEGSAHAGTPGPSIWSVSRAAVRSRMMSLRLQRCEHHRRQLLVPSVISERVNTSSHLGSGAGAMVARCW
jgi:N-acetylgalactosamine-N,N'-diacetylbacillosaminyl-diphospho-undecaprenol 4-alpha-N-acetylgalactosaminyltransferase